MKKTLVFFFLMLFVGVSAQIAERPSPSKLYNNLSREFPYFLDYADAEKLEEKLEQFSNETSNQVCVVIVDDLNGMEASQYAVALGTKWGVGKKGLNNGIVILVKPTGGADGRDLFIAVGYGLEGILPDLATKHIEDMDMFPYLKKGRYYEALDKGTDAIMKLAKGEISVVDYVRQDSGDKGYDADKMTNIVLTIFSIVVTLIICFIISLFSRRNKSPEPTSIGFGEYGPGGSLSSKSSSYSGGSSGGRSSSSGGWGGFGGGSFGGGGAGGKW